MSVSFFLNLNCVALFIKFLILLLVKIIFLEKSVYKSNPLSDL